MRDIPISDIIQQVKEMTIKANIHLNPTLYDKINQAKEEETSSLAASILGQLKENADLAKTYQKPICQDTGMAVFFVKIGQEVHIRGGSLTEAIQEGVRQGYKEGYLRQSIVKDPFDRINTKDNTPAVIHYDLVEGSDLIIDFAPKGFGSENMSQLFMLKPSDGIEGAKKVILQTIWEAGPNACPPMIVGVGIGGTFEKAAQLAKESLLREVGSQNPNPRNQALEDDLLKQANELGIGPQGFGGKTTVLDLFISTYPTHIAGLPVAVNISCHATRHEHVIV